MRRTIINLTLIAIFLTTVALGDFLFMKHFTKGLNGRLEAVAEGKTHEEKKEASIRLDEYFESKYFWAYRLIHTGRLDEVEALLRKLNAYILTEDESEVQATVAELQGRVELLFNYWHHPRRFSIE